MSEVVRSADFPIFPRLVSLAFLGIGLELVVGRLVLSGRRKERTSNALTSERAIIVDDQGRVNSRELGEAFPDVSFSLRGALDSREFRNPQRRFGGLGFPMDPRLVGMAYHFSSRQAHPPSFALWVCMMSSPCCRH